MSTGEYAISMSLSAAAVFLWAMNIWGGWVERLYERQKDSYRTLYSLRLGNLDLSKENCVSFVRAISLFGIVLVSIGMLVVTRMFLQK